MLPQHGTLSISRSRLRHNLALIRERVGSRPKLCAIIKADAYGHGAALIAGLLAEAGIEWVCVYGVQEAAALTRSHPFKVLVLAPLVLQPHSTSESLETLFGPASGGAMHGRPETRGEAGPIPIRLNVTDVQSARLLSRSIAALERKATLQVHMQVDAGLTRMGVAPQQAAALAAEIASLPGLELEGVFAHFSHGDVPGHPTLQQQRGILMEVARGLRRAHPRLMVHLQNSGGAWNLAGEELDMVRLGIALYGLQPSTSDPIPGLLPIAEVTAPILAIHDCAAGTGVGYGHTFTTRRKSRLAVVPVGYAEGYPRGLSNRAVCQVRGKEFPVVGRVSMDQIIVDATDLPEARVGEVVTVISNDPARANSLDRMADALGTIGYELATHLGSRLNRVVSE
jgi:alanine racemase